MTAAEIIKDIKARKFKPVYLLHGEEAYYIDQVTDYIESNVLSDAEKGFNQTVLYGKDTDMGTVLGAAKRYPMMSEFQVVVVKEAQDLKWAKEEGNSKEAEFVLNYFEKPLPSTILVLAFKYANFDKRKKIYKAINKSGLIFQSELLRDYKIGPWIEEFIKAKGYKIDQQATALMAEYLGTDLSKIANEIEKLMLNVPKDQLINTDLVQKNIGISKEYNVFELQKALATRDVLKCNKIINYFASNPKANPMVMVLANLASYFTKILKYHYVPNKADAASALGISPFFVKDFEMASRNYSNGKVFSVISLLREYDLKSKGLDSTGNIDDGELLKELVFKIVH
ncbi:DNA polymerase III subunit delta [Pedobacter changchengzhani]|uniref:DNA polymerase III subunit delta n=1 Tax=Pedobacter changchengzhani TaxID=2529274 RepID=A0A4V3A0B0_9SPHI|nr:DNA polymerase III subunit delta [Pedobacter changchengzhani]TDG36553.1 DNA polymerase III subunit delta [Pedobacter changchengzhani]